MTPEQIERLQQAASVVTDGAVTLTPLPNGSQLVRIPGWKLCPGWNRDKADVLFVVPVGYPAAQPDCFWVEPANFRLVDGNTPKNSNDANPIPGDTVNRSTTWFSWHVQSWNPSKDTLRTFFDVIKARLDPAR